ncbi:hypothetical protein AZSI13_30380 [Azospira sp. I13]|nr:hypothetical protein AZSI13_30380 [Azospira sp. I13]
MAMPSLLTKKGFIRGKQTDSGIGQVTPVILRFPGANRVALSTQFNRLTNRKDELALIELHAWDTPPN